MDSRPAVVRWIPSKLTDAAQLLSQIERELSPIFPKSRMHGRPSPIPVGDEQRSWSRAVDADAADLIHFLKR
jgi:hypothetical protein